MLRFRVRQGLEIPFTRLGVTIVEAGVVADAGAYATLVEIVRLGEGIGTASRVVWHVNPSKRQVGALTTAQAEALLRGAPFRTRYTRSRLSIGGRTMTLVEFSPPIEAGPFVLVEVLPGVRVDPPDWAMQDVSHDPSTELMQVVLDASRRHP